MQASARALAERFSWDDIWRRTRELYEEVVAAKTRSASAPQRSANTV